MPPTALRRPSPREKSNSQSELPLRLLSAKGVQFVGPLPAELQNWFVNTAGVSATAKQPDAAKALIKHLTTPEAAAVIKAKGMEPPGR